MTKTAPDEWQLPMSPSPSPWQPPFCFLFLWICLFYVPYVCGITHYLFFCLTYFTNMNALRVHPYFTEHLSSLRLSNNIPLFLYITFKKSIYLTFSNVRPYVRLKPCFKSGEIGREDIQTNLREDRWLNYKSQYLIMNELYNQHAETPKQKILSWKASWWVHYSGHHFSRFKNPP